MPQNLHGNQPVVAGNGCSSAAGGRVELRRSRAQWLVEHCGSSPVGQWTLARLMRLLHAIEMTVQWIVPDAERIDRVSGIRNPWLSERPVRSLPWLLFLPAICALRLLFGAACVWSRIRRQPSPFVWHAVVYLQCWQRELRSVRLAGIRRRTTDGGNDMQLARNALAAAAPLTNAQRLARVVFWWWFAGRALLQRWSPGRPAALRCDAQHGSRSSLGMRSEHSDSIQDLMTKRYRSEGESSDSDFQMPSDADESNDSDGTDECDTSDYDSLSHSDDGASWPFEPTCSHRGCHDVYRQHSAKTRPGKAASKRGAKKPANGCQQMNGTPADAKLDSSHQPNESTSGVESLDAARPPHNTSTVQRRSVRHHDDADADDDELEAEADRRGSQRQHSDGLSIDYADEDQYSQTPPHSFGAHPPLPSNQRGAHQSQPLAPPSTSSSPARCSSSTLGKHLSKSASELSCHDCSAESANSSPQRAKSAANPAVSGVLQKTHGFFSTLKHRWTRGRSKERGRRSPHGPTDAGAEQFDHDSPDYAGDNSSEQSSSATQSPRHRSKTLGGSPLARPSLFRLRSQQSKDTGLECSAIGASLVGQSSGSSSVLDVQHADEVQRRRETALRQHAFFQLRVHLISGSDLVAMDKNGTSDPYVKFKLNGRLLHKSKTVHRDLNPVWDETFIVPIEDPFQPINIKVFDYDWGLQDDFMGTTRLDLTQLDLGRMHEHVLKLEDPSNGQRAMGELRLNATLWPRTQEDKEQYFQRNPRLADASKRLKSQIWSSVVTIVLVEARNLPPDVENSGGNGLNEQYVRFRLGNEKFKSKSSWQGRWLEQFDLHLFDEDQMLEVTAWNRNGQYGKCTLDLRTLTRESTHGLWQQLEDCTAEVFLLLTISGTTASETITDLTAYKEDPRERASLAARYSWPKALNNLRDVGHLTVKVFGATGLAAADLGGKSDPFCVLELINSRLQTQTEYKTLTPNWNKIFTFNVKDMSSVLEVTVFDEDRDHKVEFLGRVVIPLLRIHNGERRWYALKDKTMFTRAKGNSPQILLELNVVWSPLRAAFRALQPKEEKLVLQEAKFKRQLFLRNVTRMKAIVVCVLDWGRYIQSCFEWESPIRSLIACILWVCGCIWFDLWTIPTMLLLLIFKNWVVKWISGSASLSADNDYDLGSDDEDDDDKDKEEKKSIKERLHAIQEVSQTVQNAIGYLASLCESVRNTFNFSVPELSWLAALLLFGAALVLHFVPIRILLLLWGIVKFSRRLVRPHSVPNNEVLDLLSRVPDNEQMICFRELPPQSTPEMVRRDPKKKSKAV